MTLTLPDAQELVVELLALHEGERESLDKVYDYWTGRQPLPLIPSGTPAEVRRFAQMSRSRMIETVVDVTAQALYVDGYRADPASSDENAPAWGIWQANKMDARQTGVHRAALAYGTAYVVVLPGDPLPVIRGVSPRLMCAVFDEDSGDWPYAALEEVYSRRYPTRYRLFDEDGSVLTFERGDDPANRLKLLGVDEHGLDVCPVVRFRNEDRLEEPPSDFTPGAEAYTPEPTGGEVEPLIGLQDQHDVTTFDRLVAQHFQSFRQRYIMGWTADDETAKAKANASSLWTFESEDVKVGEFGQVDLKGYLDAGEATVTQMGVTSQTPGHELLGKMVNLSAEALVAAEVGQRRKVNERQSLFGESWEQMFALASRAAGFTVSDAAQVRWRDTEARSLSQTIDALGKLAQMLKVPAEMLWERIPGISQQDVERWKNELTASQLLAAAATPPEAPEPEGIPVAVG